MYAVSIIICFNLSSHNEERFIPKDMKKIIVGLLLTLFLFNPLVAIRAVGITATHKTGGHAQNLTSSTTSSVSLASGAVEVLLVSSRTGITQNPNQPTVSGNSLTWTPVTSVLYDDNSDSRRKETVFIGTGTPTTGTITINFGGQTQTDDAWTLDEFTGVDTTNPVVQYAVNAIQEGGSQTTITATLSAFSDVNNATYGGFGFSGNDGPVQGSGFTKLNSQISSTNVGVLSEWKSTNDTTVDGSLNIATTPMGMIAIELRAQVTGTPIPTPTPTPTVGPTATPSPTPTTGPTATPTPTPTGNPNRPDHTVVVVEENQKFQDVIKYDYFTKLANDGALMVNSYANMHPSQPNYYILFSGSAQGITTDDCPPPASPYSGNNLGHQLLTNGLEFIGYSENLPSQNARTACNAPNKWDNNHTPWVQFSNIPQANSKDFTQFPIDFTTLPDVSFVIPNLDHDSHDGTIQQSSDWLAQNIDSYEAWAKTHNSLLIVTYDEDDDLADNHIYTVFIGPMIKKGLYNEHITHYDVLATLENLYSLPKLGTGTAITDIFNQ